MNNILKVLASHQIAMDLGCGHGSFNYSAYSCRIVGVDVDVRNDGLYRDGKRIDYITCQAHQLPLSTASVDAVICNHSLEHVTEYEKALGEIRRVLKPRGLLWISVPNGFGLDDALYRLLYSGGGHVNRFTFDDIRKSVEAATGLKLLQTNTLVSSFIYCKTPDAAAVRYLPRRLRLLHRSKAVATLVLLLLNGVTRLVDKAVNTRLSIYGWGFVFGVPGTQLDPLPSYFNVCSNCGAGSPAFMLAAHKYLGMKFYRCLFCKQRNLLFVPPPGFE